MRAKLARAAEFEGKMTCADDGNPFITGPRLDETAQGTTQFHKPPGLWQWWGKDIRVDGYNGQIGLWPCRDDGTRDAVIYAQFITEREIEPGIQPGTQEIRREFFMSLKNHAR